MPSKLIAESILIRGGAFKQRFKFKPTDKEKERYFFIVNFDPRSDEVLLLYTSTTNIKDREAHRRPEVLVKISPADYKELGAHCVIDCDSIIARTKIQFMAETERGELCPLEERLQDTILHKICEADKVSRVISQKQKERIIGPTH